MSKRSRASIFLSVISTVVLALFVVLAFPPLLWAQGNSCNGGGLLTIGTYQLVSSRRISATVWAYTYAASITNSGTTTATGVLASVTSLVSTTVLTNGTIFFGDVPAGATQTSTDTFTLQIDRRYPLTNSSLSWTIDCTEGTATAVIGIAGGTIRVVNHLGDVLTLTIPPLALDKDTPILASALRTPLPSPIANNIYPGVLLEPEGLLFSQPINITLSLHDTLNNPNMSLLFWLENSDLALPLANQTVTQKRAIAGQSYHFSTVIAAEPTPQEIKTLLGTIENGKNPIASLTQVIDVAGALSEIAGTCQLTGECGEGVPDLAKQLLLNEAAAVLKAEAPQNPCGLYSVQLIELASLVQSISAGSGGPGDTSVELMDKACKTDMSPSSLLFSLGARRKRLHRRG